MKTISQHAWDTFLPHERNNHIPHILSRPFLKIYAVALVAAKIFTISLIAFTPGVSYVTDITPQVIVNLTNQARLDNGLPQLALNPKLSQAALAKANDMLREGYFAHTSPSNLSPWYWFQQAGYQYTYAGENLAIDFFVAEDVFSAWMASASHRKNILNGNFTEIGIGVVEGEFNGVNTIIVVQHFGSPAPIQVAETRESPAPAPTTAPAPEQPAPQPEPNPPLAEEPEPEPALAQEPAPAPEPIPPSAPENITPDEGALANESPVLLQGTGTPGDEVLLHEAGELLARTTIAGDGTFSFSIALEDGTHTLEFSTVNSAGLTSETAVTRTFTLDTTPPRVSEGRTLVLPQFAHAGVVDVFSDLSGDVQQAELALGDLRSPLTRTKTGYRGSIQGVAQGVPTRLLSIIARDEAENSSVTAIHDLAGTFSSIVRPAWLFTPTNIARTIVFSQQFFLGLMLFLVLALSLKLLVFVRVQHKPTVLYTLLLIYASAVFLIT